MSPYSKGNPPKKAPRELAILKAACIIAAAIISEFLAVRSIMILIGVPTAIDRIPQTKVRIRETILFSEKKKTQIKAKIIAVKRIAAARAGRILSDIIPPRKLPTNIPDPARTIMYAIESVWNFETFVIKGVI